MVTLNGSRGCPTAKCSLIEAAVNMLAMINTTKGLVILNTDHIVSIGKGGDENFKITTDTVVSTFANQDFSGTYTRYEYREFIVTAEELESLLSKLPEAKHFPQK